MKKPKALTIKRGYMSKLAEATGYSERTCLKAIKNPQDLDSHKLIRNTARDLGMVKRY